MDLTDLVTIITHSKRVKKEHELDVTPKRIQESALDEDADNKVGSQRPLDQPL